MSKNSEEPEIKTDSKIDDEKEIEQKLSDLMNMGWTLLEQNFLWKHVIVLYLNHSMGINIVFDVKCGNFLIKKRQSKDIQI